MLAKIADWIAFWRPLLLIPIWTPAALGFWSGGGNQGTKGFWSLILETTLMGIGIYGLNQIYDREGDRLNQKHLPLAENLISLTLAKISTFAALAGTVVFTLGRNTLIGILVFVGLLLGVAYSVPPIRLKDRGIWAVIANSLGHGFLIYILGFAWAAEKSGTPWNWIVFARALSYAVAFGAVYLFTTVPDSEGDRKVGKKTLAVVLGARKTMALGLIGVFLAGAMGIAFGETALFLTAAISIPFYWDAVAHPEISPNKIVRANKIAVLTLALLTCLYIPFFILPVAGAIAFASVYNRLRLGVRYP